jgi:hypothetical protein
MSKRKPTRPEAAKEPAPQLPPVEPLKPRKGLFIVLCTAFAVWVGCLTTLYFKTVYGKEDPHAHQSVDEAPERAR